MSEQTGGLSGSGKIKSTVLHRWEALDRGWKASLFGILIVLPYIAGVLP